MSKIVFQFYKDLFKISLKFKYRFQFLADFIFLKKYFNKKTRKKLFWEILKNPSQAEDWLNIKRFLYDIKDLILIDIGANIGEFTSDFNFYFKPKKSYCFEPVKTTFYQLQKNTRNLNTKLFNIGVSETKRIIEMNIGSDSTLNSIHFYEDIFTNTGARQKQNTQVEAEFDFIKNDDICSGDIFLKIDVQGMEEDTLKGCKEILPRVKALLIETSFISEFKSVRPSFSHICKQLIEYDLYPICFQTYGTFNNIYPYERDVLFVQKKLLNRILN